MEMEESKTKKRKKRRAHRRARNIRIFACYFLITVCVVTAATSGYQVVKFYAQTSQEQREYKDLTEDVQERETSLESELYRESRFIEGTPAPEGSSGDEDDSWWLLTPITDDDYDAGDPTVPYVQMVLKPLGEGDATGDITIDDLVNNADNGTFRQAADSQGGASSGGRKNNTDNSESATSPRKSPTISNYSGGMGIDFQNLYNKNSDIVGWIRISGTVVDYPVVQASNNEYYLKRSFSKASSSSGCLFVDFTNKVPSDKNIVIYGHNMGSGKTTMFSTLLKYYDENYFKKHPSIQLDMLDGAGTWQIFAAFMFNVADIEKFNYSQHNFGSEAEFNDFISKAKSYTGYNTGVNVSYGDHIITLSTCDRQMYGKQGRCVVMAKYVGGGLY